MPLTALSLSIKSSWTLQAQTGVFNPSTQGPDSISFNLLNINLAEWTQVFGNEFVLFVAPPVGLAAKVVSGGTLTVGTTYYYKITGTGGGNETTASNEVSAVPASGNQSIRLTWTQLSQATGYKVYRGTAAGAENTLVATIATGTTVTFTDTGVAGSAGAPPSTMPPDYVEFDLYSFTSLLPENVTAGHVLGIVVFAYGVNATCVLSPAATNGLVWFFGGTAPTITIPASTAGGAFVLSGGNDNAGQALSSSASSLRVTNGGTGNLTATIVAIVGP